MGINDKTRKKIKITTNSTETLEWDLETCDANASIESKNGSHTLVGFKVDRNGPPDRFFVDIDHEGELRAIHKAMGDLISHLDKKRGVGREAEMECIIKETDKRALDHYNRIRNSDTPFYLENVGPESNV